MNEDAKKVLWRKEHQAGAWSVGAHLCAPSFGKVGHAGPHYGIYLPKATQSCSEVAMKSTIGSDSQALVREARKA
jgi:hypothetical protein